MLQIRGSNTGGYSDLVEVTGSSWTNPLFLESLLSLSPLLLQLLLFPGKVQKHTVDFRENTQTCTGLFIHLFDWCLRRSEAKLRPEPRTGWNSQCAAKCLCRRSLPESSSWLCSPRYPLHSSLSQTIKLRFDLIGATERAAITPISRSTTKKYNVKAFAKKLLCSQSQSRFVLNGAWCAANKLATFWPSPGPVWCSAEPQPWSLRTSPHLAPRRRSRRDMGPTVLPVWRLRMALPSRLLFHAAFSPCWRALCDVIISRRTVLCDVKMIIINK